MVVPLKPPPQQDLDSKRLKALGHDRDQRISPRAGTPQEREHSVGEDRDVGGAPAPVSLEDRPWSPELLESTQGVWTLSKSNQVNVGRSSGFMGGGNAAMFHTLMARQTQEDSRIGQSEKPRLDASREPTRKMIRPKDPGTPDVEGMFGMQLQSEPQEAVRAQQVPDVSVEHLPKETDQRHPRSTRSSSRQGVEGNEQWVQADDEKELRLLKTDQKAEPTEVRQEYRFFHDRIFSRLDFILQRALFAVPLGINAIRYLRPKLPPGCKRIEWQCSCGVLLYADYRITSPASALALESLERRLRTATLSSGNDTSYTSPSTSGQSDKARGSPSSQTTMSSVDLTDLHPSTTQSPDGSSSMRQKHGSGRTNAQTLLELCVNTAPLLTVLEEIHITSPGGTDHIDNDFSLFQAIRDVYYAERHKTKYRWLRTPVDFHFVKFAGISTEPDSCYVNVDKDPKAFPPQKMIDDGLYDMHTLPYLNLPIWTNEFLHLVTTHSMNIDTNDRKWLPLFPKKCGERIRPLHGNRFDNIEPAWGVRIIEGPSSGLFLFATTMLAVVLIAIGLGVASALGDTYKGVAVAVGGFVIGSQLIKEAKEHIKDSAGPSKEKEL